MMIVGKSQGLKNIVKKEKKHQTKAILANEKKLLKGI